MRWVIYFLLSLIIMVVNIMLKSKFLQECSERGFLNQCTNLEALDEELLSGQPIVAYWGTDPTGPSMHVGHLFSLMMIRLFQKCGNKPIIVIGGATARIGDPSGKDKTRPMITKETIDKNIEGIKKSIGKFIKFGDGPTDAILVNNADWMENKGYLEILGEVGRHISVNRMLTFESVKQRLSKTEHMSFLEFNYMILQAYDFYHLYKKYGCTLQLCGGDQWGNVVAGVDLIRKLQFESGEVEQGKKVEVIGFSTPLLTDANGKKIGKSEGNAVWVNEELFSPYDYFQYFRNVNDKDVLKFLRVYTDLSIKEINEKAMNTPNINDLKKLLAFEATKICHGEEEAKKALEKSIEIFEKKNIDSLETIEYKLPVVDTKLSTLLKELNFTSSFGEARRLIQGNGVKINDNKVEDLIIDNFDTFKLSVGKKKIVNIKIVK